MIRGLGRTPDGRLGLVIGLTPIEIFQLTMGAPVHVRTTDLHLDVDITLISGDTEQDLSASLRRYGMVNDDTVIAMDPDEVPRDGQS